MKKMSALDRILLLGAALLAAYQIVVGIEGAATLPLWAYTTAFGVLLLACLLLIILGFESLQSPAVLIAATVIPLSLSLGLVWEQLPAWRVPYLLFTLGGLLAVAITRFAASRKWASFTVMGVHGIAGLFIFFLPILSSARGLTPAHFALVGLGGALIGVGGMLLSFLRAGKPILSQDTILTVLPALLLGMTAAFVAGFI